MSAPIVGATPHQRVRNNLEELGLDRTKATVRKFLAAIGLAKGQQRQHYVGRYMLPGSKDVEGSDEFSRYLKVQLKHFVLDYDDLVYFTLYIFDHFETVRRHWQQEINYVQVDEVQDCDRDEWDVINAVSGGYNNLCIVGDPDQAIYEWRGARPSLFVNFKSDRDIFLTENYRSTPQVLSVANSLIEKNSMRLEKWRRGPEQRLCHLVPCQLPLALDRAGAHQAEGEICGVGRHTLL